MAPFPPPTPFHPPSEPVQRALWAGRELVTGEALLGKALYKFSHAPAGGQGFDETVQVMMKASASRTAGAE